MKATNEYNSKLKEFKSLNSKRVPSKGFTHGLTNKEYSKINSLHSYFMRLLPTKEERIEFLKSL